MWRGASGGFALGASVPGQGMIWHARSKDVGNASAYDNATWPVGFKHRQLQRWWAGLKSGCGMHVQGWGECDFTVRFWAARLNCVKG